MQEASPHGARDLLTPAAFEGVLATVMGNNPGMDRHTAARVTEEGLKFVAAAARFPAVNVRPSPLVDEGWHALILHTAVYAELCGRLGHFVHHRPDRPDAPAPTAESDATAFLRSVALIEEAGFSADAELWRVRSGELTGAPAGVTAGAAGAAAGPRRRPGGGPGDPGPSPSCSTSSCGSSCGGGGGD